MYMPTIREQEGGYDEFQCDCCYCDDETLCTPTDGVCLACVVGCPHSWEQELVEVEATF